MFRLSREPPAVTVEASEAQPDKPSRPEAIRRLVERGMKAG